MTRNAGSIPQNPPRKNPPHPKRPIPRRIGRPIDPHHRPFQRRRQMHRPRIPANHQRSPSAPAQSSAQPSREPPSQTPYLPATTASAVLSSPTEFTNTPNPARPSAAATAPYRFAGHSFAPQPALGAMKTNRPSSLSPSHQLSADLIYRQHHLRRTQHLTHRRPQQLTSLLHHMRRTQSHPLPIQPPSHTLPRSRHPHKPPSPPPSAPPPPTESSPAYPRPHQTAPPATPAATSAH